MSKKEKISIPLFVSASVLVLIFLAVSHRFIVPVFNNIIFADNLAGNNQTEKIYLNEDYQEGDPFITKNPDLKDMLAGPIISQNDPSLGVINAPVNLVVFSDFQCNICHKQETVFKQILEKYKDKVRMTWKDYPDKNVSSNSFQASLAGRCANEQGKFWLYHDFLFENSSRHSQDVFIELAKKADLNIEKFTECLAGAKYQKEIKDNILEANALDINGVPFIYVNEQEIMGEIDFEELSRLVEMKLK